MILAIDPGNIESGYVVIDGGSLKPLIAEKVTNVDVLKRIKKSKRRTCQKRIQRIQKRISHRHYDW